MSVPLPAKTEVIIIGAGPTGLSMAAQLIRFNIDFVIVEKHDHTTVFSKAVVVQARTLEIFQEIFLADSAVAQGRITTALNMFYKGRRKAFFDLSGLGKGISPFPFALGLEQSKTEQLLADHVRNKRKNIFWGTEFIRFEQDVSGVKAYCKNAAGQEQLIEAEYLVGCDGASSLVRHQMGASFEGDTVPKNFYVADVKLTSPVINKAELFIFLTRKGFSIFFPMEGNGHYRIVGVLPEKETVSVDLRFEDIQETVKEQLSVPINIDEVKWFSTYKVHSRKASSFMNGRCFIAGDAAHIHTPAGGQGMNTGIQDAYNLAWKIGMTLSENMNPMVLESYNTERMQNAKHLLKTTDRMFDVMAGSGRFWNFTRLKLLPLLAGFISKSNVVRKKIFPLISQTGISYKESAMIMKSRVGKVKAGDRLPYFTIQSGESIFDFLTQPYFKVIFYGFIQEENILAMILKEIPVAPLTFPFPPKEIFGELNNFFILLRPDNHIAYIGIDLKPLEQFLKTLK